MFQSLFYWILFSYELYYELQGYIPGCFNPYSIGFYSLILNEKTGRAGSEKFQSLFYWILFSYAIKKIFLELITIGFNPYSIGFYSLIHSRLIRKYCVL